MVTLCVRTSQTQRLRDAVTDGRPWLYLTDLPLEVLSRVEGAPAWRGREQKERLSLKPPLPGSRAWCPCSELSCAAGGAPVGGARGRAWVCHVKRPG